MTLKFKMADYEYENAEQWDLEKEMFQALAEGLEARDVAQSAEVSQKVAGACAVLDGLNLPYEVCGAWVWVDPSERTRQVKDTLKEHGFRWASRKGQWYFPGKPSGGKGHTKSMTYIREKYGSVRSDEA